MKAFIIWTLSAMTAILVLAFIVAPSVPGILIPLALSIATYILADRWYGISQTKLELDEYI